LVLVGVIGRSLCVISHHNFVWSFSREQAGWMKKIRNGEIMRIEKFFDPENIEHIKAYRNLQNKGVWPEDFIPTETEFGPGWQALIAFKIAHLYVEQKMSEI